MERDYFYLKCLLLSRVLASISGACFYISGACFHLECLLLSPVLASLALTTIVQVRLGSELNITSILLHMHKTIMLLSLDPSSLCLVAQAHVDRQ